MHNIRIICPEIFGYEKIFDMKKSLILISLVSILVLNGCDAFRKLAGRPTAAELEAKRVEINEAREAAHRARIDSLKKVEKALADSLAILDSLKQMNGTILNPSAMGGLFTTKLDYRYYIVVGAFTQRSNAEVLLEKVQKAGFVGTMISFRNGFNAIGICNTDNLNQAFLSLKKVQEEDFCPDDAWILVNE